MIFHIMDELVAQHKSTFDPENPRDYIDAFLKVQETDKEGIFTGEQLVRNVYDLYAGKKINQDRTKFLIMAAVVSV